MQLHDAGADTAAADIHRENRLMPLEHPTGGEVRGADKRGIVRIVVQSDKVDRDLLCFENDRGAADRQLAEPAVAESPSDRDALGVAPGLKLEKFADHHGEFLRKILDGPLDDAARLGVAIGQGCIESTFRDVLAVFVPERVLIALAHRLAPLLKELAESRVTGTVAVEALIILQ